MRDIGRNGAPVELVAIREHLRALAIEEGANDDEAAIEGEISGFVASLFLTHRGFAEIWQMGASSEGRIFIKDRWPDTSSYEEATIQIAEERGISLVEVEA